ncbi:MAG: hypothetical protein KAQ95_14015, partial [Candidatus Heimdallarchaeota archaeon]|nr:hypothetical protein [Candidatus Heimdallarchaeota archaeon]
MNKKLNFVYVLFICSFLISVNFVNFTDLLSINKQIEVDILELNGQDPIIPPLFTPNAVLSENTSKIFQYDESYGWPWPVHVSGNYAFVSAWLGGMQVFDISDPDNPIFAGSFENDYEIRDVKVDANRAYVANMYNGLLILDISNLSNITQLGRHYDGGAAYNIDVVGDLVFLADYHNGLEIINVSIPSIPVEIGSFYNGSAYACDVDVNGSYAFVAEHSDGLRILNISDPTNPTELSHFFYDGTYLDCEVLGNFCYVAVDD